MWEIDRTFLCNLYFFVPTFSRIELYDMFLLSIKRTEPIHAILAAQYIVYVRLSLATLPSSAARCHCAYSLRPFPWRRSPVWSVEKRAGQCARNDVMWWIEAAVARVPRALTAAPLRSASLSGLSALFFGWVVAFIFCLSSLNKLFGVEYASSHLIYTRCGLNCCSMLYFYIESRKNQMISTTMRVLWRRGCMAIHIHAYQMPKVGIML